MIDPEEHPELVPPSDGLQFHNLAATEQDIENWHTIFLSRPRDPRGALEELIKQRENIDDAESEAAD